MNRIEKYLKFDTVLLIISVAFYMFFALFDGIVICADSPSYITMDISREPLYPLFLACLRVIFGAEGQTYLYVAVVLQSLLAAWAAYCITAFIEREFSLGKVRSLLVLSMVLGTSFLCRFAAKRASMYSNSILTEGIAISMYLLFIRYVLEYCFHQTKKSLLLATISSLLLVSVRKQMILALVVLLVVILCQAFARRRVVQGFLLAGLCSIVVLFGNYVVDGCFNYYLHGSFATHSSDNRFLSTVVMYVSEREDATCIPDEETRDLFLQIYDVCDGQGYLQHSAGKGWYQRVTHFGDSYDAIQIDTLWPMIEDYVREKCDGNRMVQEKTVDMYNRIMIKALLPNLLPKLVRVFADNFVSGMVTTVAKRNKILIIYSMLIWLSYGGLMIYHMVKKGMDKLTKMAGVVFMSCIFNVAIVSAVIFCQTRYTVYNMPLFYISLFLLFTETVSHKNRC